MTTLSRPRRWGLVAAAILPLLTSCAPRPTGTLEENKKVVRRFLEAVNSGDVTVLSDIVSPDYVEEGDASGRRGVQVAIDHVLGVRQAYPDIRLTIDQQIAEGEWVVSRVSVRATHLTDWLGMKPTGKPLAMTSVNVDRVVEGRIVYHGGAANLLFPFLEIGAIRVVGPDEEEGGD